MLKCKLCILELEVVDMCLPNIYGSWWKCIFQAETLLHYYSLSIFHKVEDRLHKKAIGESSRWTEHGKWHSHDRLLIQQYLFYLEINKPDFQMHHCLAVKAEIIVKSDDLYKKSLGKL